MRTLASTARFGPGAAPCRRMAHARQSVPASPINVTSVRRQRRAACVGKTRTDSAVDGKHMLSAAYPVALQRSSSRPSQRKLACSASTTADPSPSGAGKEPVASIYGMAFLFPVAMISGAAAVHSRPDLISWVSSEWLAGGLALSMLGVGSSMEKQDWERLLHTFGVATIAAVCQFGILFALSIGLSSMAGLSNAASLGLSLIACCPGGPFSGVAALIARGDAALSTGLTISTTLLAVLTIPWMTSAMAATNTTLPALTTSAIFKPAALLVLLPILAGGLLRSFGPQKLSSTVKHTGRFAGVLSVATICALALASSTTEVLKGHFSNRLLGCIAAMHAGGFILGYILPRIALGLPGQVAQTFSLTTGMQNSAAALMLAALLSSSSQPGILAPVIASVCISSLMGSCLAAVYAITARNKAIVSPDAQTPPEPDKPPTPPAATQQMAEASEQSAPKVPPAQDGDNLPPWVKRTGGDVLGTEKSSANTNNEAAKARAWIEAWRTKQAEEARANVAPEVPVAPGVITIESVSAGMQTGGSPDAADVAEVRAWIGAWREKQADAKAAVSPAAPVAPTRPDGAEAADARAWIGAWREKQADTTAAASPAAPVASTRPDGAEAADVRAWIAAWRARQAASIEPASQALEKSAAPDKTQAPMQPKATSSNKQAASSKVSSSFRKEKKKPGAKAGQISSLFPSPEATKESLSEASRIVFNSLSSGFESLREELVGYASQNPGARKLAEEQAAANAAEARAWIAAWRRNQESLKNAAEARAWIAAWRSKKASANPAENLAKGLKNAAFGTFAISTPMGGALKPPKALSLPKLEDAKDGLIEAQQIVVGNLARGMEEMDTGIKALRQAIGSSAEQRAANDEGAAVISDDSTPQAQTATETPLQHDDNKADVDEVRNWIKAWREKQH